MSYAMLNMFHLPLFFFTVAVLCTCLQGAPAVISKTIRVNLNGQADYKTIQEAIQSVPNNNDQWIKIHVAAGIYREKVLIRETKSNIFLEGEGADKTSIEWGDHFNDTAGHRTLNSATFTCRADNFVASNIAFKNTYGGKGIQMFPAVAALISGDKSAFYGCSFSGLQDTLCDHKGRHYYKGCKIEGVVDFIFGEATTIYEECKISTVDGIIDLPGHITAHGRDDSNDMSGYVFKNCSIEGTQRANLGRAWRPYSRVIFYKTRMMDNITPQGWVAWTAEGRENDTTFVESECEGPGSNVSERVSWEKKLSDDQLKPFIDLSFIDKEGWIYAQPLTSNFLDIHDNGDLEFKYS